MAIRQYSISTFQQILLLSHGVTTVIIVMTGLFYFTGSILPHIWVLSVYLFLFLFYLLPTIALHVQYFSRNKTTFLKIDKDKKLFSISNDGIESIFNFSDIKKIKFFGSYGKGTGLYSFGEYRYCEIILNDKLGLIITCLMVNNIETRLKDEFGIELEKKYKVFAFIK